MNKLLVLLVAGLGLFVFYKRQADQARTAQITSARGLASGDHNCKGTEKCVLVYVAPWCPGCKQLKPHFLRAIKQGRSASRKLGFRVVVGQGTPEQNREEAASFGPSAAVDADGSLKTAYGVSGYPSFLLVDQNQKLIAEGQGAVDAMLEGFFPEAPKLTPAMRASLPPNGLYLPLR